MPPDSTKTVLFLCTGNYYRSRFSEYYFRHVACERGLAWDSDSRGLDLHPLNEGPMYSRTRQECERLGIDTGPTRYPIDLAESDLERCDLVIAVKEAEHRPLMRMRFPDWEDEVRYWTVHDLDAGTPDQAFPLLRELVNGLIEELAAG